MENIRNKSFQHTPYSSESDEEGHSGIIGEYKKTDTHAANPERVITEDIQIEDLPPETATLVKNPPSQEIRHHTEDQFSFSQAVVTIGIQGYNAVEKAIPGAVTVATRTWEALTWENAIAGLPLIISIALSLLHQSWLATVGVGASYLNFKNQLNNNNYRNQNQEYAAQNQQAEEQNTKKDATIKKLAKESEKLKKLMTEQKTLLKEKAQAINNLQKAVKEKDALIKEKGALIKEKDALIKEKDALIQKEDALIQKEDALIQEEKSLITLRASILEKTDLQLTQMQKFVEQLDSDIQTQGKIAKQEAQHVKKIDEKLNDVATIFKQDTETLMTEIQSTPEIQEQVFRAMDALESENNLPQQQNGMFEEDSSSEDDATFMDTLARFLSE